MFRSAFVKNALEYLRLYEFDGLDIGLALVFLVFNK
jgi:hypothetical protein